MKFSCIKVIALFITCYIHSVTSLAVMSVDLGGEWMKVAFVSPGVPMEIALNKESQRKTPVAVSFRDGERVFGDPALTIAVRFPDKAYMYLLEILGKKIDNPLVDLFKKRFPFYEIEPSEDRESLVFKHPDGLRFTVEELVAMVLKQAQEVAEKAAGQPIKDAVITVPPFFNQVERRSLLQAARLSGLNILQLINSNTAVALNYGIFRRKDFNETPANIMFYDMGACNTVATVVTYQLMKSKETGEINPQLTVKGVGFDHTLGGLEMQLRLRDHFAHAFNSTKKTSINVFDNIRSMAKLFKEAGRVKKVLSANTEHTAQVESLLEDEDFKVHMTRAEFEGLCSDLLERVTRPIDTALKSANMDMINIDQVILSGSGTRVPRVQQILLEHIKMPELGKSLNTDESAALGAVYQAAHLSKGFKVKTFLIKDANIYPIQVDFQREYELEDKTTGIKTVKRTLFNRNNGIPLKKIMTFNRHIKDFDFYVNYGELNFLNDFEIKVLGSLNISQVFLKGIESAVKKNMDDKTEYKGVKAHIRLDESGLLNIEEVEAVFEKAEEDISELNLESAFTKLGNTIGRLFSGAKTEYKVEDQPVTEANKSEENKINETKPEKSENISKETDAKKNATDNIKKDLKILVVKEPLTSSSVFVDMADLSDDQIKKSSKRLKDLDKHDQERLEKAKAKNSLESFLVETKDKLYRDEYEKASKEEEREKIMKSLTEASDWLEYDSDGADIEVFKSKLLDLRKITKDLFERVREHQDRPEALKALNDMLNISERFLAGAKNMTEDEQIFTEVEMKTLENLITETKKWHEENVAEQNTFSLSDPPKLTIKSISEKLAGLDREVKYLLNKARFAQPLKKKTETETKKKNESNENTTVEKESTKSENVTKEAANEETSDNITIETKKPDETTATVDEPKTIDIPEVLESKPGDHETTGEETATSPSPDKVKDDQHSEL